MMDGVLGAGMFDVALHARLWGNDTSHVKAKDACATCVYRKAERYCSEKTVTIGTMCEKNTVVINGVIFKDLLTRVTAIERYIARCELTRNTAIHPDLVNIITDYM